MEGHGTATMPQFASMSVDELQQFRNEEFSRRLVNKGVAPETREWLGAYVDALIEAIEETPT